MNTSRVPPLQPSVEETGCIQKEQGDLRWFEIPGFPVRHFFFARQGGLGAPPYNTLNTAWKTEDPAAPENRRYLLQTTGLSNRPHRVLNPCHGRRVWMVAGESWKAEPAGVLLRTDAALTKTPVTALLVSTGDCIPAVFADSTGTVAGLAHFGWRNLAGGFIDDVLAAFQSAGVLPSSLRAAVGPTIGPCCYVHANPVQEKDPFWAAFLHRRPDDRTAVDLTGALRRLLIDRGVSPAAVSDTGLCTACRPDLFFSHYRDGARSGRQPTLVILS